MTSVKAIATQFIDDAKQVWKDRGHGNTKKNLALLSRVSGVALGVLAVGVVFLSLGASPLLGLTGIVGSIGLFCLAHDFIVLGHDWSVQLKSLPETSSPKLDNTWILKRLAGVWLSFKNSCIGKKLLHN